MLDVIKEIGVGNAIIFCTIVLVALTLLVSVLGSWILYFFARAWYKGKKTVEK